MTIDDVAGRSVSRETQRKLELFELMVAEEARRQNLVAPSTMSSFRTRHVIDSLQLLREIPSLATVCDIGAGAGLPGVILACANAGKVTMVEPRRLRADFLRRVVEELGLNANVECARAQALQGTFEVITARAVASLDRLVAMTHHLSGNGTTWVLPKGRNVQSELEVLRRNWQCDIGEVQSVTDPDARIITLKNVRAKVGR